MIACPKSPKSAPQTNKQAINFDLNPPKYVHISQKIDVRFRLNDLPLVTQKLRSAIG